MFILSQCCSIATSYPVFISLMLLIFSAYTREIFVINWNDLITNDLNYRKTMLSLQVRVTSVSFIAISCWEGGWDGVVCCFMQVLLE